MAAREWRLVACLYPGQLALVLAPRPLRRRRRAEVGLMRLPVLDLALAPAVLGGLANGAVPELDAAKFDDQKIECNLNLAKLPVSEPCVCQSGLPLNDSGVFLFLRSILDIDDDSWLCVPGATALPSPPRCSSFVGFGRTEGGSAARDYTGRILRQRQDYHLD